MSEKESRSDLSFRVTTILARLRRRQAAYRHLWLGRLTIWGGAVAIGLVAVAFAELIDFSVRQLHTLHASNPYLILVLAPAGGGLVVWLTPPILPWV